METTMAMEEKKEKDDKEEEAKRARKRSRYLSPPYTTTTNDNNVAVADMLSALRAAAVLDMDAANAAAAHDLDLLRRFFTLHITSSSTRVVTTAEAEAEAELNPIPSSSNTQKEKETETSPKKKKKNSKKNAPTRRRLPLTDVRKNLEKMISSLLPSSSTSSSTATHGAKLALAGEMRGLLAKVDKMLSTTATATAAHRH